MAKISYVADGGLKEIGNGVPKGWTKDDWIAELLRRAEAIDGNAGESGTLLSSYSGYNLARRYRAWVKRLRKQP